MQSLTRLTLLLCFAWAVTLLYGEMVSYWVPRWKCSWPQPHRLSSSNVLDQVTVAVLADPQIMDRYSLGLAPQSLALEVSQFYTDLYMRRSFHTSILPFKPDIVVFLGDQFDGGPFLTDQEWQESLNRFRYIFGLNEQGRFSDTPVYYLSGNHDIGYANFHLLHPKVITRYEREFGARNYNFPVGEVEFVAVDAQTLDGPKEGNFTSLSWDFIKKISQNVTSTPRVLLTHIPLYRPDDTPCGPYRSSGIINQRVFRAGPHQGVTYVCLFAATIILLAVWPTNGFGCWERFASFVAAMSSNFTGGGSKEKDDEDCEYEMIWDAEGSMHLVRKAAKKVPITKLDAGLAGRANLVARPVAKRNTVEELDDASLMVEVGVDSKSDSGGKGRPSKSRSRRLIQRLIRVFWLLVVVAAVNIPLYMMLLFKDWIDR